MDLTETRRLLTLAQGDRPMLAKPQLRPNAKRFASSAAGAVGPPGLARVVRFLQLLGEYDAAPWASIVFDVNQEMIRRLTHSHLPIIAGEHYNAEKAALEALVNAPDRSTNVIWITNRQQGKTSTLAKFLAALLVLAPTSGSLCCIYSTNYDRAAELLKAAKMYVDNMPRDHPLRPT